MAEDTLKTVERTLLVLRAFTRARPELTVADLVGALGLPRAVVTRIVTTLERAQFLERASSKFRYRIGIAACEVGAVYLAGSTIADVSRPVLRNLAEESGHTVYMGIAQGADVVIVATFEGRAGVRFTWTVGDRLPVATTALGKAILLHASPGHIDRVLGTGSLPGLTPNSVATRSALDVQLRDCREQGWIPAFEESLPGVYAVGAAPLDPSGQALAGISVSFLRDPDDPSQTERLGSAVHSAAREISRRLAPQSAFWAEKATPSASRARVPAAKPVAEAS